jgi:hypothetical protein
VHEKRLQAFMTAPRDDVTADRRFELVPSFCALNCPTEGPALGDRLRAASQAGAQILIIGIVGETFHQASGEASEALSFCLHDILARMTKLEDLVQTVPKK